jgi:hypothetical protein
MAADSVRVAFIGRNVEREIIARYTEPDDDGNDVVQIEGYDADPASAAPAAREALEQTLAEVVAHRVRYDTHRDGIQSESIGRRSVAYAEQVNPLWPQRWQRHLAPLDTRQSRWEV